MLGFGLVPQFPSVLWCFPLPSCVCRSPVLSVESYNKLLKPPLDVVLCVCTWVPLCFCHNLSFIYSITWHHKYMDLYLHMLNIQVCSAVNLKLCVCCLACTALCIHQTFHFCTKHLSATAAVHATETETLCGGQGAGHETVVSLCDPCHRTFDQSSHLHINHKH